MLNIKVQCCGMVILWLASFFYCRLPRMMIRTKRVFNLLLFACNICIVTDILSVIAIFYAEQLPDILVIISCKLYLFNLIFLVYCGFLYICADIYINNIMFKKKVKRYGAILLLATCLMSVLPIYYVCMKNGNIVYSYGTSTTVVYLYFAIMLIAMFVHMHIARNGIQPRRRMAVVIWLVIWLISAIWQFLDSELLIVSFAGSFGVIIVFFMIENPELSLDKETNFFNTRAMVQYMSELYINKKQFFLFCTQFQSQQMNLYMKIKNSYVFVGGGEIYFLFEDRAIAQSSLDQIAAEFNKQPIYVIWDVTIASIPEDLLLLLKGAQRLRKMEQHSSICIVDAALKQELEERKKTQLLIREAIRDNRIEVFYQPIYAVKECAFHSAEALIRIRDKDGSIVLPGKFIPVAEDEGSIIMLGKIVFEKVCFFLTKYQWDDLELSYIEVNLSVIQGEDRQLVDDVISSLKKYNVSPDKINLEITESASLSGKEQLQRTMETLRAHGIEFALDDFGTGQSNLDYMASMPVQLVKFDRAMTQGYFTSQRIRSIMDASIRMIHDMGMKIVAEGIETKEQFECMKKQDIDYIQGFYFSRPLPEVEFIDFLKKNKELH